MIFDSNGQVSPFQYGNISSALNGAQSTLGGGSGTDNNADRPNLQPGSDSTHAFAYLDMDVTPNTNVYFQGLYGKQSVKATNLGGDFQAGAGQPITIFAGNAFLPDSLRQAMADNNIASFTMGRIGNSLDIANNAYVEQDTTVKSGTLGFKSNVQSGFLAGWTLDGYYQYGKTNVTAAQIGGIRIDRLYMALDAVTEVVDVEGVTTTGVVGLDTEDWVVQPTPPSPSSTDSSTAYPVFQPRLMTTSPSAAKSRP
jgi:hypothetical protein